MKPLCTGFIRSRYTDKAWEPCPRPAIKGERLCQAHRDSLDSVVLGLFLPDELPDEKEITKPDRARRAKPAEKRRAKTGAPGHGKQARSRGASAANEQQESAAEPAAPQAPAKEGPAGRCDAESGPG
jgi:hypothetical protein